jgi:hypothetical protein
MDYKETIKERLSALSPKLRVFVLDENWRREAEKIGKQFNFDEEKYVSFENEVFLVLLCFESKNDFAENIKKELEVDANMASWIAEDVNKNIFSKVANEIEAMWQEMEQAEDIGSVEGPEQSERKTQTQNNIGESFEQIVLNQAKAMQPAREAPVNLPTGEAQTADSATSFVEPKEEKPKVVHNYTGESDPYREPIE